MLIDIDRIVVGDRIRKDFGDIQELADNIKKNGLLNPLTVNGDYKLLAGERRLKACKLLGWSQVDVRMVESEDEAQDIEIELSENNVRRNFTGSELAEGIRRQMAIESEKAKERQGARTDLMQTFAEGSSGTARDKAAEQFGISGEQARKTLYVADNSDLLDPSDFADWDEGRLSTNKAYQRIKAAQKKAEQERDAARRELDAAQQDLADAWQAQEDAETEVVVLKRKLESIEKPKPEVVEREVVREVKPKDYDSLRQDNERLNREYQEMWRKKQELDRQLEQANELLGEKGRTDSAQRDIEALTSATNAYLRQYGGKVWAFDQFDRVDKATQEEFEKAITSMAAFAQNMAQMIRDRK